MSSKSWRSVMFAALDEAVKLGLPSRYKDVAPAKRAVKGYVPSDEEHNLLVEGYAHGVAHKEDLRYPYYEVLRVAIGESVKRRRGSK